MKLTTHIWAAQYLQREIDTAARKDQHQHHQSILLKIIIKSHTKSVFHDFAQWHFQFCSAIKSTVEAVESMSLLSNFNEEIKNNHTFILYPFLSVDRSHTHTWWCSNANAIFTQEHSNHIVFYALNPHA